MTSIKSGVIIQWRWQKHSRDRSDRVPEELWTEVHNTIQETDQNHPKEKEMQEGKVVV